MLRRVVSLLTVLGIVLAFGAFEVYGHPFSSPEQRRSSWTGFNQSLSGLLARAGQLPVLVPSSHSVKFVIGDTMPGATEQTYSSDGRTLLIYVQSIPARWQSPPSGTHVVTVQGRKGYLLQGQDTTQIVWFSNGSKRLEYIVAGGRGYSGRDLLSIAQGSACFVLGLHREPRSIPCP